MQILWKPRFFYINPPLVSLKVTGSAPFKDGLGIAADWSLWISHFTVSGY